MAGEKPRRVEFKIPDSGESWISKAKAPAEFDGTAHRGELHVLYRSNPLVYFVGMMRNRVKHPGWVRDAGQIRRPGWSIFKSNVVKYLLLFFLLPVAAMGELRLNQIQTIGTHNSYHLAPTPDEMKFLGMFSKRATTAWDYSRRPLGQQLESKLRHFELDIFADPEGGLYAKSDAPEDDVMRMPGMKVLHVPKIDARSGHPTFKGALKAVRAWSAKNQNHLPVMILIELKDKAEVPFAPKPVLFDRKQMEEVEKEILSVFKLGQIITPDSVRGELPTLREAIMTKGWPLLRECRGKVICCLDNGGGYRDIYLKGNPSLKKRLLFVSVDPKHPAAAWMKRNDPVGGFAEIQRLVKSGFLVRTRADADTQEARANDRKRAIKALASGAQFVSTDFPVAVPRISEYEVTLPDKVVARPNPVSAKNGKEKIKE